MDDGTTIVITFPDGITLTEGCDATSSDLDDDSNTCTGNVITFTSPFTSDQAAGTTLTISVATGTNQDSVSDAGTLTVDVYATDDSDGQSKLKDQYSGDSGYIATAGSILRDDGNSPVSGGVDSDSFVTYYSGALYTFYITCEHAVGASGYIKITLDGDSMGTGSVSTSDCAFNGAQVNSCSVDDSAGTVLLQLTAAQSISAGEDVTVTFGGIRNPRTFEQTGYIAIETQDSDQNVID